MRRYVVFSLVVNIVLSMVSRAGIPPAQKLHPALREFAASGRFFSHGPTTDEVREDGRVSAILYTKEPERVRAAGIHVNSAYEGFVTALLSPSEVTTIAALDAVTSARPAIRMSADNDLSKVETGAQLLHDGFINQTPYKGKGAIVFVYDTGIDWKHLDFRDPADSTKSRILFVWDQTLTPTGAETNPSGFNYGVEYTKAQIEAEFTSSPPGFVREADVNGHGTHVTGTAAGSGNILSRFAGTAPEADIIFVKGGNNIFHDPQMIDGLTYAAAKANALGKPIAVNWSLGGMWGPHDATSPTAKAIDAFCANPGRIHVNSAGNSGLSTIPIHIGGTIAEGGSGTITIRVPSYTKTAGANNDNAGIYLIFSSADSGTLVVKSPNNRTYTLTSGRQVFADDADGSVTLENIASPDNGQRQMTFWVEDNDASKAPVAGAWTMTISGVSNTVTYNGWLDHTSIGGTTITMDNADNIMTVNESVATLGLMVGSYFTRYGWPMYSTSPGEHAYYTYNYSRGDIIGQTSPFSSIGPSRDGRTKPDVVAPGHFVMSAYSSSASFGTSSLYPNLKYAALSGTSMAAPNATGCAAVLLGEYPTMTAQELKNLFTSTANTDAMMGSLPNNAYGAGKLNVFRAMASKKNPTAATRQLTYRYDLSGLSFNSSYMNYTVTVTKDTAYALRFTPSSSGPVAGVSAGLLSTTFTRGAGTALQCAIYSNTSGSVKGIPGARIGGTQVVLDSLDYWTTVYFDLLSQNIAVNGGTDYHVVISLVNGAADDKVQLLADDGTANADNRSSMASTGGTWANSSTWASYKNRNVRVRPVVVSSGSPLAIGGEGAGVPLRWVLEQNYPNPFNPTTNIEFRISQFGLVKLAVYDLLGREVAVLVNEPKAAGSYTVRFSGTGGDGSGLASGMYLYRLTSGGKVQVRKMMLVK